jgi:dienelactone hydrolase
LAAAAGAQPLPATAPLTMEGDIPSQMIDGIDRFLLKQIERTAERREGFWKRDAFTPGEAEKEIAANRARLAHILGIRDARPERVEMELIATTDQPALVGKSPAFEAYAVRWRAFGDVYGEGLLLKPVGRDPIADVIAIPDADQTPEQISGLAPGVPAESQYARRLAESGCHVIVPVLLDRTPRKRIAPGRKDGPEMSNREFIYRSAYELGRHVIGYEVEKIMAAVDWAKRENPRRPVGVFGWGEGGMLALYTAALDPRVKAVGVSGYFGRRESLWKEPIERNVFGLLERFGDVELAAMVAPRKVIVETSAGPHVKVSSKGAAPAELTDPRDPAKEADRASAMIGTPAITNVRTFTVVTPDGDGFGGKTARRAFLAALDEEALDRGSGEATQSMREAFDPAARQARQLHELDRHTQEVLARSAEVRQQYMKKLDTSSLEKYDRSAQPYRNALYDDILGRFDQPLQPMNPRTRKVYDTDKFVGYEVVLEVFPDVFAYGVLLLPKDLKEAERRPVVVCQHGLEGRPQDTIVGDSHYYHDFAARLASEGFITFSPQNLYIFGERFRTFSRKANPIGKTIWSVIIPQHQQILNFLKTLPNVDAKRIGFYGLSYGGKTAMRVPAVLSDYCLSICSGDFNEWVVKISSSTLPFSYMFTYEYEIPEFDQGSTFNHAEMAALIAPRPFMVERGHADGVSTDEWVAFEFAKVRRLYDAGLKIGDRCEIEFFDGPHTIHAKGTFEFLRKHLNWEKR